MAEVFGRIDVHSHLLPGIDDGCRDLAESLACARKMVAAGYTHSFCTPHIWASLPQNRPATIERRVAALQASLDQAGVALKLFIGGEMSLDEDLTAQPTSDVVTYGGLGKFCLFDVWCAVPPPHVHRTLDRWMAAGLQPILAHPERVACFQNQPSLVEDYRRRGIMVQGNLQCIADQKYVAANRLAERYLSDGVYDLLGSDLHRIETLDIRLAGLARAAELVGDDAVEVLTKHNPRRLIEERRA